MFGLSGFLAGLAALLHAALVNQGSHIDGSGYELNAIAAVVIGGTSLSGGTGTVLGSMVGGYAGARLARRVDPKRVRPVVVGLGWALTAAFFWRWLR